LLFSPSFQPISSPIPGSAIYKWAVLDLLPPIHPILPSNGLRYPLVGRAAERRPTGKMLRRRKMLGTAPESPASGARFVGTLYVLFDDIFIKLKILCQIEFVKCF
jgi:hypothetical protein